MHFLGFTIAVLHLARYHECGPWAGKIFAVLVALDHLFWLLLEWLYPRDDIDTAPSFPSETYHEVKDKLDFTPVVDINS